MNKEHLIKNMLLFTVRFIIFVLLPALVFLIFLPLITFVLHSLMIAIGAVSMTFFSYWSYVLTGIFALFGFVIIFILLFSLGRLFSK